MNDKTLVQTDKDNKPARILTPEEIKQVLLSYQFEISPLGILKSARKLMQESDSATGKEKEVIQAQLEEKLKEGLAIVALDKHHLIAEALDRDKYRTLVIEIADQLIAEYACKTTSEKMLAETASWAYCRMLEYSSRLNGLINIEYLSNQKNGYYSMLSKEVDRCNRQYLAAIHTLRQVKQPKIAVTFRAHNAFVAQNQQINTPQGKPPTEKNDAGQ